MIKVRTSFEDISRNTRAYASFCHQHHCKCVHTLKLVTHICKDLKEISYGSDVIQCARSKNKYPIKMHGHGVANLLSFKRLYISTVFVLKALLLKSRLHCMKLTLFEIFGCNFFPHQSFLAHSYSVHRAPNAKINRVVCGRKQHSLCSSASIYRVVRHSRML